MFFYGQLVLVLCVLAPLGEARRCKERRDITEILADPCGGRNPVRRVGRGRRETCQSHNQHVYAEAERVVKLAQRLVKKYTNKEHRSSRKIRISNRLENYLFSTKYFNLSGSLHNYDDIAAIAFHVHTGCRQEPNLRFKKAVCKLEDALTHLLCTVRIANYRGCLCLAVDSKDAPGPMDLSCYPLTTGNNAARHQRDFVVFRDTASYFKNAKMTSEVNC